MSPTITHDSNKEQDQNLDHGQQQTQRAEHAQPELASQTLAQDQKLAQLTHPLAQAELERSIGLLQQSEKLIAGQRNQTSTESTSQQTVSPRADALGDQQRAALAQRQSQETVRTSELMQAAQRLDQQQAQQIATAKPAERPGLEQHHAQQQERMADLVQTSRAVMTRLAQDQDALLQRERDQLKQDMATTAEGRGPDERISDDSKSRHASDSKHLLADLRRRSESVVRQITPAQAEKLRADVTAKCPSARRLDDEALSRVLEKAASAKGAHGAIKGKLAEELLQLQRADEARSRGHEYIAGDRVRDAHGRELGDGLEVHRDAAKQLQLDRVYEIKSGTSAAASLTSERQALSRNDEEELSAYAKDVAREDMVVANRAQVDGISEQAARARVEAESSVNPEKHQRDTLAAGRATVADLKIRTAGEVSALQKSQRESGQLAKTAERIAESTAEDTQLYIDGSSETLKRATRMADLVHPVVPAGVANSADASELKADAQELADAARVFAQWVR